MDIELPNLPILQTTARVMIDFFLAPMIHLFNANRVISVVIKTGKFITLGAGKGVIFSLPAFCADEVY